MNKSLILRSAIALAFAAPLLASAESQLVTANTNTTGAQARLNFNVVIPKVLFLGVGTGSTLPLASSSTVDVLNFNYNTTPEAVGNGTASAAQTVAVRVRGNNGAVSVAAAGSNTGLVNTTDATDIIPWGQILATSADATNFNVPAVGASSINNNNTASSRTSHFRRVYSQDSHQIVQPFVRVGTHPTRNFATIEQL